MYIDNLLHFNDVCIKKKDWNRQFNLGGEEVKPNYANEVHGMFDNLFTSCSVWDYSGATQICQQLDLCAPDW